MWDATCGDTFTPSYWSLAAHSAGAVAARMEVLKEEKYVDLLHSHDFVPVAVENTKVFGVHTFSFIN